MKALKKTALVLTALCIFSAVFYLYSNYRVISIGSRHITDIGGTENCDCIIVPGAAVKGNVVSISLKKRLDAAFEIYDSGKCSKIIVSGDHGREDYDEVNAMRNYLLECGVDIENIFMDHAGFDTYDTVYRAKDVFLAKNPVIVSQESHAMRAAYIADRLGMSCCYIPSEGYSKYESKMQIVRESLARVKAFVQCEILHSKPKYLGEPIPVSGSGLLTEG
ncbi:MAG: YdcF family protein [Oscillospiraceae bacterium]|nr:YdcF family protein [Oscillospiraceae bacterium]